MYELKHLFEAHVHCTSTAIHVYASCITLSRYTDCTFRHSSESNLLVFTLRKLRLDLKPPVFACVLEKCVCHLSLAAKGCVHAPNR